MMSKYTKNIGIKTELYEELEERKRPGQSFTGVIRELINIRERHQQLKKELRSEVPEKSEELIEDVR